jgi:hypothetical protein
VSKKSKKARKPNVPMYTGPIQPAAPAAGGSGGGGSEATLTRSVRAESIQADYTYVVADLKRIGLLAGLLITVLIVLSFFIR